MTGLARPPPPPTVFDGDKGPSETVGITLFVAEVFSPVGFGPRAPLLNFIGDSETG